MRARVHQGKDDFLRLPLSILTLPSSGPDAGLSWWDRQGKFWAALSHPHLLKTYRFDRGPRASAVWMERPPGSSLATVLAKGPPLATGVRSWLDGLVSVLKQAHDGELAHGALTPHSVWISERGAMLAPFTPLSFGASLLGDHDPDDLYDLSFLAPERWNGTVTPAADVYGLGALLFAVAMGRPPFAAAESATLADRVAHQRPPEVTSPKGFPAQFADVVSRCLAKRPDDRPAGVVEVFQALFPGDRLNLLDFKTVDELKQQASRLFAVGAYPGALEAWQDASRLNPADPVALSNIGTAHFLCDRLSESQAAYLECLEASPYHGLTRASLSRAYFLDEHEGPAEHLLNQAVYCWPGLAEYGYGSQFRHPLAIELDVGQRKNRTAHSPFPGEDGVDLRDLLGFAGSTLPLKELIEQARDFHATARDWFPMGGREAVILPSIFAAQAAAVEAFIRDEPAPPESSFRELRIPDAIEGIDYSQSVVLGRPFDPDDEAIAQARQVPPRAPYGRGARRWPPG